MFKLIKRWFFMWSVLAKYRLDKALPNTPFDRLIAMWVWLMPSSRKADLSQPLPQRIRMALEELGPIFVKFGQAISTRPDLLSPEMAKELAKLQDKVTPFPKEKSLVVIETSLKQSVDEAFAEFDNEILASASIAQVHTAKLYSGEDVIVKVVRPGIDAIIDRDLRLMRFFARVIHKLSKELRRLRLPEVVEEFSHTIHDELDLRQEAANAGKLRANFEDADIIYVPKVYWQYVRRDVMVMERIFGVQISDMGTLRANNVNMEKLSARGVEIFFTQVFYHRFFHADMHPGNIFVDISNPDDPQYMAVDFGIMGSLSDEDQYYLAENFLAFFNRDYHRVAKLHIDSGWVPSYVKVHEFEAAIRKAGEPIFGQTLKDISFGEFLLTLFQTARRFDMHVQPQLILLQKTVFNVEGLGRVLYPELDLWATAKPILEQWMKDSFGPKALAEQVKKNAGEYRDVIPKLPRLINQQLEQQPKPDKTPWLIALGICVVVMVQPDLWLEHITRPVAAVASAVMAWKVWRMKA